MLRKQLANNCVNCVTGRFQYGIHLKCFMRMMQHCSQLLKQWVAISYNEPQRFGHCPGLISYAVGGKSYNYSLLLKEI